MPEFQSLVAAAFHVAHFVPTREILTSGSQPYRDLIPRGNGAAVAGFRQWFLSNGRRFDGGRDESGRAEVRSYPSRSDHRHDDAFVAAQTLAEDDGLLYWEGYALSAALPVRLALHHAWNTAGDALVDVAWSGAGANKNLYFGVPVAHLMLRRVQTELATGGRFYRGPLAFLAWVAQSRDGQQPPFGFAPVLNATCCSARSEPL